MQQRKNFIFKNEKFVCENCKKENPLLKGGCRNHCKFCLCSKHVDKEIPGDRKSGCNGLMKAISVEQDSKKGYIISQKCTKCRYINRNKIAPDDDFDAIIELSVNKMV